jgi:2-amino-4-hydroxy-6-hydroxymethyldihydropteridine diphosphokinase
VTRAVLCLGSNEGDSFEHLRKAVAGLAPDVVAISTVYETPPWGDVAQPAYLNAAVLVSSSAATPREWLERAWTLERAAGRQRDSARRFGPRTLDVDVIAVWADDGTAVMSDDPELTIPHPRAHLRAFVLRPMLDVAPDAELRGHGSVADLLRKEPVATDLLALVPRPDLDLTSARTTWPGRHRPD